MHPKDQDNYEPYDMEETGSDNSEYEPPNVNAESSIEESAESDSDYEDTEGGFRRLNSSSKKKQLVIKDGKIMKTDKLKGKDKGTYITYSMNRERMLDKTNINLSWYFPFIENTIIFFCSLFFNTFFHVIDSFLFPKSSMNSFS